jgi:hypothetical protein
MRVFVIAIKILLIFLFVVILFTMLMAHASGHNVPLQTDLAYVVMLVIFVIFYFYLDLAYRGK